MEKVNAEIQVTFRKELERIDIFEVLVSNYVIANNESFYTCYSQFKYGKSVTAIDVDFMSNYTVCEIMMNKQY